MTPSLREFLDALPHPALLVLPLLIWALPFVLPKRMRRGIFSHDHKSVAKVALYSAILFGIIGGLFSLILRWQLGWPGEDVPGLQASHWPNSKGLPPEAYNMSLTLHGTVMIFFVILPLLLGAFGNFVVPLMIGARSSVFPAVGALGTWLLWVAFFLVMASLFAPGEGAGTGWTAYAPGTAAMMGPGQSLWLLGLALAGLASILTAIHHLATILAGRVSGMSFGRLPLTVWSIFVTAALILVATPVLASGLLLQLSDRLFGSAVFLPSARVLSDQAAIQGGGSALIWQHLFWFYSHPAVYMMVLPAMGMISDMLSAGARKPLFGHRPMMISIGAIAVLGFLVWGHHMFTSGMQPGLGRIFMVATIAIALPSALKTFNWLATLWGSKPNWTPFFGAAAGFVSLWVMGGLSGLFLAATPIDIHVHDTYFVVAHFHYIVFGATLFSCFGALYYWFPKFYGRRMNATMSWVHLGLSYLAFHATFFPMHVLGTQGMLRRVADPYSYGPLQGMLPMNRFISLSAMVLVSAQILLIANLIWSALRGRRESARNPFLATSLEWMAPSPPLADGNFDMDLKVVRGPYEYGFGVKRDEFRPQGVSGERFS